MNSESVLIYREVDPDKKNKKWADSCVGSMRQYWKPLIYPGRMRINKAYLYSQHSVDHIKSSFKDKKFLECTNFRPLGLLESIRNSLAEEMTKNPPRAEIKATDPTAISERKEDIQLLKNRNIVEKDISKYNAQVGLPPHKVDYKKFNGNAEEFDKMGLDANDPDDINFFEQNIQRLDYEIAGQAVIDNVMKNARFDEDTIKRFVDDNLAARVQCMQSYVDQLTGEIKFNYVYPETAYGIFGDANDGHDDICRGWQDSKTVMEWLQLVGNEFDFERDWRQLLWSINFSMGYKYTGFMRNNRQYDIVGSNFEEQFKNDFQVGEKLGPSLIDWTIAYTYKIYVGYIEWNTAEATSTFKRNYSDENYAEVIPYSYELNEKEKTKGYYSESFYQQQWYRSYFIATTSISQWLYGYQKVYYQQLEGANDEYALGTCIYYRQEGMSAVEVVKEFIDMVELTWYKIKWLVFKSKPQEEEYLFNELIEAAKGLQNQFPQTGNQKNTGLTNQIQEVIQYEHENNVRVRFFPQVDGKTYPQVPVMPERKNGLDVLAIALQTIFEWAKKFIGEQIGWNPVRSGANPQSRESFRSTNAVLESSENSTGYFYRMIQYTKERLATSVLTYAQDIIQYPDSIPYKWLLKMIGNDDMINLSVLRKFCAHRYGMFIRDYNYAIDKKDIKDAASMALQQKEISFDQWFVVTQTEDPKQAAKLLAYQKLRQEKKLRQQAISDIQQQHNNKMQEIAAMGELEDRKGQYLLQQAQITAQAVVQSAQIQSGGRENVKRISVAAEPEKQAAKTEGDKELAYTQKNLEEQSAYPVGT